MVDSILFVGGYVLQDIGSLMVLARILRRRSIYGISINTQVLYFLGTLSRAIWSKETRLLDNRFAIWELGASVIISFMLVTSALYFRKTATWKAGEKEKINEDVWKTSKLGADYSWSGSGTGSTRYATQWPANTPASARVEPFGDSKDEKKGIRQVFQRFRFSLCSLINSMSLPGMVGICALLAILVHPGSRFFSLQILVAFTIYVEAIALVPQLVTMGKSIDVENLSWTYVILLSVSKMTRLGFWITLFLQNENFISLLLADCLHFLLVAEVTAKFVKSLYYSEPLAWR